MVERPDGSTAQETCPAALSLLRDLIKQGFNGREIAEELNAQGYKTGHGLPWNRGRINATISQHKIRSKGRSKSASRQLHRGKQ